jgi:hypothetical protein
MRGNRLGFASSARTRTGLCDRDSSPNRVPYTVWGVARPDGVVKIVPGYFSTYPVTRYTWVMPKISVSNISRKNRGARSRAPRAEGAPLHLTPPVTNAAQLEIGLLAISASVLGELAGSSRMSASRYKRGQAVPEGERAERIALALGFPRSLFLKAAPANELDRFALWGLDTGAFSPEDAARLRTTPAGSHRLATPCVDAWLWLHAQPADVADALSDIATLAELQSWLDGTATPDELQAEVLHDLAGIAPESWHTLDGAPIPP